MIIPHFFIRLERLLITFWGARSIRSLLQPFSACSLSTSAEFTEPHTQLGEWGQAAGGLERIAVDLDPPHVQSRRCAGYDGSQVAIITEWVLCSTDNAKKKKRGCMVSYISSHCLFTIVTPLNWLICSLVDIITTTFNLYRGKIYSDFVLYNENRCIIYSIVLMHIRKNAITLSFG